MHVEWQMAAPQRHDVGQMRAHARAAAALLRIHNSRKANGAPKCAQRRRIYGCAAAASVGQLRYIDERAR